jgi:3D (Asp-Asp-Asp) domain-containing protein
VKRIVLWLLTAYCPCLVCTGGSGVTKSGTKPRAGVTVACSPELLGLRVRIAGYGIRVCEDTGSAVRGKHVDVYFDNHKDAVQFGLKRADVEVLR